jgi:hypothetical protein
MRIRVYQEFSMQKTLQSETATDFRTLVGAIKLLLVFGVAVILLFLIFLWDVSMGHPFQETSPTELFQSFFLLCTAVIFFTEARRCPDMREALVLAGGFIGCMLIREQDYFLDMIAHGCWKYPAIVLTLVCCIYAARSPLRTLAGLAKLIRWRYFPILLIGVVLVLAYSRLFGMSLLWRQIVPGEHDWWTAKTAMEESSELLGYATILLSAILLHRERQNSAQKS